MPGTDQNRRVPSLPALFGGVTLLSAFLLFQVQLILAKALLPWFGGSAAVWTTCVLFFQVVLLLGYGYVHATGRLAARARFRLHAALLLLSAGWLAFHGVLWRAPLLANAPPLAGADRPTLSVLAALAIAVGLPFWLLSSTSPLLQDWWARARVDTPYWLYALSNLGSLAGLLTYPFVVEPTLSLQRQAWLWAAGYLLFCAGVIVCGWSSQFTAFTAPAAAPAVAAEPRRGDQVALWIVLPAAGSALFLATTNFLLQDIASTPLLWVPPLALYLLSFVVVFSSDRLYRRFWAYPILAIMTAVAVHLLYRSGFVAVRTEIWVYNLVLFFATLFCHGEVARLKPEPRRLTSFYLYLSLGAALGSAFVTLLAPRIFPDVWEFHGALVAVAVLAVVVLWRDRDGWARRAAAWQLPAAALGMGVLPLWAAFHIIITPPPMIRGALWIAAALYAVLAVGFWLGGHARPDTPGVRRWANASMLGAPLLLAFALAVIASYSPGPEIARRRNFYGVFSVVEEGRGDPERDMYELYHGRTLHGLQSRNPAFRHRPASYYSNWSGVGLALRYHPRRWSPDPAERSLRVGVLGLGVGTVATYGLRGDDFRVYEINPAIAALSAGENPYFTYLRDSLATTSVVLGDGRLSLQREADAGRGQQFDLLILDAFNGDAIPLHLLTREAFALYVKQLRNRDSMIAVNITNRVLDIRPVVARLAMEFNLEGMRVEAPRRGDTIPATDWILLSLGNATLKMPPLPPDVRLSGLGAPGPLWTDDFTNLLSLLR